MSTIHAQVRLLERLPSGSRVFAEQIDGTNSVSVQLWISAKGTEETPLTNGWRHLVEHFMAKRLDTFTDERGIFLSAETSREAMSFKFEAPADKLSACLEGAAKLFEPIDTNGDAIAKEAQLIRHEESGLGVARRFSRAGWAQAFENSRPDPVGELSAIAQATPDALKAIQRRMLAADNLVLTICGAVEPNVAVPKFRQLLSRQLASSELPAFSPPTGATDTVKTSTPSSVGSAVCLKLEGIDRGPSLARIAFALAVAQAFPEVQPLYTVSSKSGLLTLASSRPGVWDLTQSITDRQLSQGPVLLKRWIADTGRVPSRLAAFRGALLSEGSGLTLEMVQLAAAPIGFEEVKQARGEAMTAHRVEGFR
ncbi:MAG: insulinase family protein [Chthonomonas sp.]|nr:insulinase family protein [Chthonomonas sp.]